MPRVAFALLLLLAAAAGAAAEIPVLSTVALDRNVEYASIPHGKLAMDIARPKAPGRSSTSWAK